MKKILLGSSVGAIIMFVWSFVAWVLLPIHHHTFQYTPAQDTILKSITDNIPQSGTYMLPMLDNANAGFYDKAYKDAMEKNMKEREGKPMATIVYIKNGIGHEPIVFIRGFLYELLSVFCMVLVLAASAKSITTFTSRLWIVMLVAVIISSQGPLMGMNFMGQSWDYTKSFIVDAVIGWGLCGIWLAWLFGRK